MSVEKFNKLFLEKQNITSCDFCKRLDFTYEFYTWFENYNVDKLCHRCFIECDVCESFIPIYHWSHHKKCKNCEKKEKKRKEKKSKK